MDGLITILEITFEIFLDFATKMRKKTFKGKVNFKEWSN